MPYIHEYGTNPRSHAYVMLNLHDRWNTYRESLGLLGKKKYLVTEETNASFSDWKWPTEILDYLNLHLSQDDLCLYEQLWNVGSMCSFLMQRHVMS